MTELLLMLTLIVTATIVIVLVAYLLGIIFALWSAKNSLAKLAVGLMAIRDHTAPLSEHMQGLNQGLSRLLTGLLQVDGNLAAVAQVAREQGQAPAGKLS
ncbi:hypothetical protein BH24PSE2_BH24PSE2_06600 [soil metagenome]